MEKGSRRIQTGGPEEPTVSLSSVGKENIFRRNAEERGGIMEEETTEIKEAEEWRKWNNHWRI